MTISYYRKILTEKPLVHQYIILRVVRHDLFIPFNPCAINRYIVNENTHACTTHTVPCKESKIFHVSWKTGWSVLCLTKDRPIRPPNYTSTYTYIYLHIRLTQHTCTIHIFVFFFHGIFSFIFTVEIKMEHKHKVCRSFTRGKWPVCPFELTRCNCETLGWIGWLYSYN